MTKSAPLRSGSVTRQIVARLETGESPSRIVTALTETGMDRQEARDHVAEVVHAEATGAPGRFGDVATSLVQPAQERLAWRFIMGATLLISGLTVAAWHHMTGAAGPVSVAYTVLAAGVVLMVHAAWQHRKIRKAARS